MTIHRSIPGLGTLQIELTADECYGIYQEEELRICKETAKQQCDTFLIVNGIPETEIQENPIPANLISDMAGTFLTMKKQPYAHEQEIWDNLTENLFGDYLVSLWLKKINKGLEELKFSEKDLADTLPGKLKGMEHPLEKIKEWKTKNSLYYWVLKPTMEKYIWKTTEKKSD